eukprot:TRINITY_DN11316_c0_g1_i1.p3 TRINITY_DN11316_c0_g1~~TRINITY_DN11316_c0_g1_i1.p3  ORF type:complete len:104 (-),score=8.33 TRINITY_DN11316_c0_g1_i1:89-400(-)
MWNYTSKMWARLFKEVSSTDWRKLSGSGGARDCSVSEDFVDNCMLSSKLGEGYSHQLSHNATSISQLRAQTIFIDDQFSSSSLLPLSLDRLSSSDSTSCMHEL